jgi:hypothetical protein
MLPPVMLAELVTAVAETNPDVRTLPPVILPVAVISPENIALLPETLPVTKRNLLLAITVTTLLSFL